MRSVTLLISNANGNCIISTAQENIGNLIFLTTPLLFHNLETFLVSAHTSVSQSTKILIQAQYPALLGKSRQTKICLGLEDKSEQ